MDTEVIRGGFINQLWRDRNSGFTIFKFRPQLSESLGPKLKNGYMKAKGVIPEYTTLTPLELRGVWESNKYGWTFAVHSVEEVILDDLMTVDYLVSLHISKRTAQIITNEFGQNLFEAMKNPGIEQYIAAICDISVVDAVKIASDISVNYFKRELIDFLFKYGGKMIHVERLYRRYGKEAIDKLKEEPFKIGVEVNLPLKVCDSIFREQGKPLYLPERVIAFVKQYLEEESTRGNVFSYTAGTMSTVTNNLNAGMPEDKQISSLQVAQALAQCKEIVTEVTDGEPIIYLKWMRKAETDLAYHINRLLEAGMLTVYSQEYREFAEAIAGFEFAPEQRAAFNLLAKTGIGILTGGPGTGKTTVVKGILDAWDKMYPDKIVKLCAPTGRAAQRMSESTGRPATTIHRLLEYKPYVGSDGENDITCKNEKDPINADFIVVDETSMLDVQLASMFLAAVKSGALVLFVGDINQLQSVGPGDVLNDMIKSKAVPVERLVKTYRQASDSNIIKNAAEINFGHSTLTRADDFEIIESDRITDTIVEIVKKYHKDDDLFYTQVLSPSHKNDGGVGEINLKLQEALNPNNVGITLGKVNYRLHDKIIMTKNNATKNYFNGDVGEIIAVSQNTVTVNIQNQEITLDDDDFENMKLAYAMTIHKSQGSEFPVTIIALPQIGMLRRNLLYTAVTRAKNKVIIVQQPGAIAVAVKRNDVGKRNSNLASRIHRRREESTGS